MPLPSHVIDEIKSIVGSANIIESYVEKLPYRSDASPFIGEIPELVVLPRTPEEISRILTLCNEYRIPVVPRGGGTSLTGASVPVKNSIVISLLRLNDVLEISPGDNYVLAEAGVRLDDLNMKLRSFNYFFPPDPGSSLGATIGGIIATNAGGLTGAKFGVVKDWVLGLQVVLPTGEIIWVGNKTLKHNIGYDLTSLFIGSEGTLGIVTKAYLKIWPLPEKVARIVAFYEDIESVGNVVVELKKNGITPFIAELIDKNYMRLLRGKVEVKLPSGDFHTLMIDIDVPPEAIERYSRRVIDIMSRFKPLDVLYTSDPEEMERLRTIRKTAGSILLLMREKSGQATITSDVVVPPSKLAEFLKETEKLIEESKRLAPILGHVGDGNIHADIFTDFSDPEDIKRSMELNEKIAILSLKYGGSVSAEHGIGLEKRELLVKEYQFRKSEKALELMKNIKKIFDPNNIMNPTKMFL